MGRFFWQRIKKRFTFEELRKEVQEKGIKSSTEYEKVTPKYGWPASVILKKKSEFTTWDEFFSRDKFDFEKFNQEVLGKGIKSTHQYLGVYSKYKWPSPLTLRNKPEFTSWDDFLGRESKKKWTFEELRNEVRERGITSPGQYKKLASKNNWPYPETLKNKPEFTTWNDFFGRTNP